MNIKLMSYFKISKYNPKKSTRKIATAKGDYRVRKNLKNLHFTMIVTLKDYPNDRIKGNFIYCFYNLNRSILEKHNNMVSPTMMMNIGSIAT